VTTNLMAPADRAAQQAGKKGSAPEGPGATTGQANVMTTSTTARPGRRIGRIGRIVAVGAVALVLAGTAAANPAEAMRRYEAVQYANSAVDSCFSAGGDASAYDFGGSIGITCIFEDGGEVTWDIDYDV
jgi:hypothetical protein